MDVSNVLPGLVNALSIACEERAPAGFSTGARFTIYFPSPSESPGMARSTESLTRCHESFAANLARSHSRREVPRAAFQSRLRSPSTSSKLRPGYLLYEETPYRYAGPNSSYESPCTYGRDE